VDATAMATTTAVAAATSRDARAVLLVESAM
jgi:hypothetical protein